MINQLDIAFTKRTATQATTAQFRLHWLACAIPNDAHPRPEISPGAGEGHAIYWQTSVTDWSRRRMECRNVNSMCDACAVNLVWFPMPDTA